MKNNKFKTLAINLIIILFEILGFSRGVQGDMFVYYTNLSNLAALIACVVFIAGFLFGGKVQKISIWLKYLATCMTTVTIVVVIGILVPMQGIQMLYYGEFLYFHLICPVLMLISFLFFDGGNIPLKKAYIGMLPTAVYGVTAVIANCVGVLTGPYPFLMVRNQPVYMSVLWFVLILGIAYLVAYIVLRFRRKK